MTALGSTSPDFLKEKMKGLLGLPWEQEASQCTSASTQSTPGAWGRGEMAFSLSTICRLWAMHMHGQPLNFQHIKFREIKKMSKPTPGEGETAGIPGELVPTDPTSSRPRRWGS